VLLDRDEPGGSPMIDSSDTAQAVDVPAEDRFVVRAEGAEAELVYRVRESRLFLIHTGVPQSLGGRGIGGRLMRAAIRRAESEHLTIVPWCPFARRWLKEHPDEAGSVRVDFTTPRPEV